jgi:hypothetical protein
MPDRLRAVIDATRDWLVQGAGDLAGLFDTYLAAEARKGPRARLAATSNGRARRAEWATEQHVLADVLHYRWGQVRTLLADLAEPV